MHTDSDNNSNSPPHKKRKIIGLNGSIKTKKNALYIVHIGPFNLLTSEVDIRKFVFINKQTIPSDIVIQIKNKKVFGFIGYNTLSEAQQIIYKFNDHKHKTIKICQLIKNDYNKYCKSLYDRSSFSNKTNWIQLFGITHSKNMTNSDEKNWITKLLKWEYKDNEFNILNIKIFHNVRYPTMSGFALIELENDKITEKLINHFQQKWINNQQFKYWIDYVDINQIKSNLTENKEIITKQLIFSNLYWKTNKSILQKHIHCLLGNDFNLEIVNIKVIATSNGYPTGTAIATFKSIEDAKMVQTLCDNTELLDQIISVCFYSDDKKSVIIETPSINDNDIDSDGDGDIINIDQYDSDDDTESDGDDIDSDDLESFSDDDQENDESDDDDEQIEDKKDIKSRFGLKDKDIMGLWKWSNPNRKCPSGLLFESKSKKHKKNWKELNEKDWLKEWNKKERIPGRDKYWIRSGKLVSASQRWRERAKTNRKIKK